MKKLDIIFLSLLIAGCGSSSSPFTSIKKPVDIAFSDAVTLHQGKQTNLAYVADQFNQSVVVLDTVQEKIVDTADGDEFDYSSLPVGGEPTSVVVDTAVQPHRIYVSDQLNKQIVAYEIVNDSTSEFITYKPIDLGVVTKTMSSRPLFKNAGASSSPTLTNIAVDASKGNNESWRLVFKGEDYEVTGTKSGVQNKRAVEGKAYASDQGEITFYISSGGEKTTKDDEFFFGTLITKPLILNDSPIDMVLSGRKIFILTKNPTSSVVIFDLDHFTIDATVALASIPNHMFLHDGKIYISFIDSGDVAVLDINTTALSSISTGLSSLSYVGADDDYLFLIQDVKSKVTITSHTGAVIKTLNINDVGTSFFTATISGKPYGFIPNLSGDVDVLDLVHLQRVDTDLKDKPNFINPEFFDVGSQSKPQLISVNGKPGVTQNETWQMVYDESLGSYLLTGSKSGPQTNRVVPGEAYTSDHDEITLRTRPSFAFPETTGDFFSFMTLDQIDPIATSSQSMAVGGIAFNKISDGKSTGYIIQQTNGQVSIVDLVGYKVRKTL